MSFGPIADPEPNGTFIATAAAGRSGRVISAAETGAIGPAIDAGAMSVPAKSFIAATLCRTAQPHVLGVPVRPVRVALPNALLVLAVSGLRTPKRARQVACGAEGSRARFDATGVPYHDLLQVPAVAVGITE